jgi:molybdopterin molybdotransferase
LYPLPVLSPGDARRRILAALAYLAPLPAERVPLGDALGRALAEDLAARDDLPPFAASTMDGYALRSADARAPGASLPVRFEIFAGRRSMQVLPASACCRITTGAPLPAGADAVEMLEEVRLRGGRAIFKRAVVAGQFVRAQGSDLRAGAVALPAGAPLDPAAAGLAAALGRREVLVHRRPRVVVLPTGDELVPPGRRLRPGQIRESNAVALAAAVHEAGGEARALAPCRDRPESLARALRAARGADVILTVGGVSVGARDLVRGALERAGARLHLWRAAIRPGKPFAFGLWGRTVVFALPGNPASALVTFELFVRPALRALSGLAGDGRLHPWVRLASAQEKPPGLTVFLRVRLRETPRAAGLPWADPLRTQRSGDLSSLTGADALAVLPAGRERFRRGATVRAVLLRPPRQETLPHTP